MNLLTIDFETYFDKDYTLTKMPMSEYVRDKRFRVWGAGLKLNNEVTEWQDGNQLKVGLKQWFDWKDITVICHNAQFDGFILTQHYKVKPAHYVCTQSMARALLLPDHRVNLDAVAQHFGMPPKPVQATEWKGRTEFTPQEWARIIKRAKGDVVRTYKIFKKMKPEFTESEMQLIDLTIKMFTEPKLILNAELLEKVGEKDEQERTKFLKMVNLDRTILRSDLKFAKVLEERDITAPTKWSVKQKKLVPAFAANDQEFQSWQSNPLLRPYYEARTNAKSSQTESKVSRLLAQRPPFKVAVALNYCGAHTLRFSGGDKSNFQNMERGSDIRRSLTAPKGYRIAVLDASQIEARLNAYFAGQYNLLEQFANGEDPYKVMAAYVYYCQPDINDLKKSTDPYDYLNKVTKDQRFVGKTLILAAGYNMGAEKFQVRMATDKHNPMFLELYEAVQAISSYRHSNRQIVAQWRVLNHLIRNLLSGQPAEYKGLQFEESRILMPNGLHLRYPDLKLVNGDFTYAGLNGARRKIYGGLLTENIMQCLARIILTEHMLKIAEHYRIVLTVHDEIVFLIPERNADTHYKKALKIAQTAPDWAKDLPVAAEGGHAQVYSK